MRRSLPETGSFLDVGATSASRWATGLFAFIVHSPKREDLLRDGRYAMHTFPANDNEDAFSVTGVAEPRTDPTLRDALAAIYLKERGLSAPPPRFDEQLLFEFLIDGCLLTRTTGHGDPGPVHTVWKADVARNQPN
jgi:hypothetical protein